MTFSSQVKIKSDNTKTIKQITSWGLLINTVLSFFKLAVGFFGSSEVVIADAIHSFSDSVTDIAIIIGVKFWNAPPDKNHPYGHHKIETVITAFIGIILVLVALGIAYDGISTIRGTANTEIPNFIAIWGPIASVIVKEILFQWNIRIGKKIKSTALIANAWHHRSDVISSAFALITVVAAVINPALWYIDNLGAIIVAVFILKVAWDLLYPAVTALTDSRASSKLDEEILQVTTKIKNVKSAHAIRTRMNGNSILVDLHVLVDGNITVTKGHEISEIVQKKLMSHFPDIIDVVIHIEPFENN